MKSKYIQDGDIISPIPDGLVVDKIPTSVYVINLDKMSGKFYLKKHSKDFEIPSKLYGNEITKIVERVSKTFSIKQNNLGVLLSGERGSGKTITAKYIYQTLQIPMLIVDSLFSASALSTFLNSIDQEVIVFFDEFEKTQKSKNVNNDDDPDEDSGEIGEGLLSILDGTSSTKKMFILTANKTQNLSEYFFNRPGRIHYNFEYKGLTKQSVREILKDILYPEKYSVDIVEEVIKKLYMCSSINIDMINAVAYEINNFDSSVEEIFSYLNFEIAENFYGEWEVSVVDVKSGKKLTDRLLSYVRATHLSPTDYQNNKEEKLLSSINIFNMDLVESDAMLHQYTFTNDSYTVYLSKQLTRKELYSKLI